MTGCLYIHPVPIEGGSERGGGDSPCYRHYDFRWGNTVSSGPNSLGNAVPGLSSLVAHNQLTELITVKKKTAKGS